MKNFEINKDEFSVACNKAIKTLDMCSTPYGLFASAGKDGYTSVWARDSMISLIGASFYTGIFEDVFKRSLCTLVKYQNHLGQIPNAVDIYDKRRKKQITFATIDSSLWFILGEFFYMKFFGDKIWKDHYENIAKAFLWVTYQDTGNDLMPEQLPTSDWQDCFPHKYGHTINTQALYFAVMNVLKLKKNLAKFKRQVEKYLYDESLGYFLPWHWKDHEKYKEKEEWFDSLGNLLAIVFGLANKKQTDSILDFIEREKIADPYPIRAIYPPIKSSDKAWHDYFYASAAAIPNSYINGGIWPYIGGFYVVALIEAKRFEDAEIALNKLVEANKIKNRTDWGFSEWIHPVTKVGMGSHHQAWSAGCFLLAYECTKQKKNLIKCLF